MSRDERGLGRFLANGGEDMRIPKCNVCGQLDCEGEEVVKEKQIGTYCQPPIYVCNDCLRIHNLVDIFIKIGKNEEVKT